VNGRQLVVRTSLLALADGRPLGDEIEAAIPMASGAPPAAEAAAGAARLGDLKASLEALVHLGLDPLVALAATREARAALGAERRLERLPALGAGTLPFGALFGLLAATSAVLMMSAAVSAVAGIGSATVAVVVAIVAALLMVGFGAAAALTTFPGPRGLERYFPDAARARRLMAAAALVEHDVPAVEAVRVMLGDDDPSLPLSSYADAQGVEQLALALWERAERRHARALLVLRAGGVLLMLLFCGLQVLSVMTGIPQA